MRLTEWERDRLTIFTAAELARRHRAAGLKLNAPESIALICDAMLEAARANASYDEVEAAGRAAVAPDEAMDGVPALVDEIRLEVLMGDGTRLVVLRYPLGEPETLDKPDSTPRPSPRARETRTLTVTNTGRRVIRVSSHYPFEQVNSRLDFDRDAARGFRLDLPAGADTPLVAGRKHRGHARPLRRRQRVRSVIRRVRVTLVLALVAIAVVGCDSALPQDILQLGSVRQPVSQESEGAISAAAAMRAASDAGYDFANRTAYLVVMTPTGLGPGAPPISERLVWLVRAAGIEVQGPIPTGGGQPAPFHYSYVLVDAMTGEVLMATYRV